MVGASLETHNEEEIVTVVVGVNNNTKKDYVLNSAVADLLAGSVSSLFHFFSFIFRSRDLERWRDHIVVRKRRKGMNDVVIKDMSAVENLVVQFKNEILNFDFLFNCFNYFYL